MALEAAGLLPAPSIHELLVLSNPLLSMETSKSIQEKMKGIKPTESASFLPASEPAGEEKTLHGPWEGALSRGRVFFGESSGRQAGCQQ